MKSSSKHSRYSGATRAASPTRSPFSEYAVERSGSVVGVALRSPRSPRSSGTSFPSCGMLGSPTRARGTRTAQSGHSARGPLSGWTGTRPRPGLPVRCSRRTNPSRSVKARVASARPARTGRCFRPPPSRAAVPGGHGAHCEAPAHAPDGTAKARAVHRPSSRPLRMRLGRNLLNM